MAKIPDQTKPSSEPAAGLPPWVTIFGAILVCTWTGNQFTPLLLLYEANDHYSVVTLNVLLGVYVLGLAPTMLVGGALSDRYGRRRCLIAGVLASVAASATLAFGEFGAVSLVVGRLLSGVGVGASAVAGSSWLKEVSQPPYDARADATAGARRASVAFTLGSSLGAVVAGSIAQWTDAGGVAPFLVHIAITAPFAFLLAQIPEPRTVARTRIRMDADEKRQASLLLVAFAPWLFLAAGVGYGYLPLLLDHRTEGWGLAYATLLNVIAMTIAGVVQPLARRFVVRLGRVALAIPLAIFGSGFGLSAIAEAAQSPALGLAVNVIFGIGIGCGLLTGLLEVQRIARGHSNLAQLTGAFYTAAYLGFLAPVALAQLALYVPVSTLFTCVGGLAIAASLYVFGATKGRGGMVATPSRPRHSR